jgi:hypothetical protein
MISIFKRLLFKDFHIDEQRIIYYSEPTIAPLVFGYNISYMYGQILFRYQARFN